MASNEEIQAAAAIPAPASWSDENGSDIETRMAQPKAAANPGSQDLVNNKTRSGDPWVEKHYRSLLKAVSWRATGTLDTILISFLVTGRIKLAVSIGFIEVFTKIGLFYVHERIWNKVRLGRVHPPEDYTI